MLLRDRKTWWIERIRQTEMYTQDRNFAGTNAKVTNRENWRIKRWRIRQFYCIYVVQLNCHGIISFMFAMVPFHLLLLILGYIACFFANLIISPRPRADASLQSVISLLPSWPDGKTVHSLPHGSKFAFRPLFAYHEPTRGRVLVQLCAELVVFLGPISYRGHLTALISAFNIQVASPSQQLFAAI